VKLNSSPTTPSATTGHATAILNDDERLGQLAKACGFQKRTGGKITPANFVRTIMGCAATKAVSFRQLAVLAGVQVETTVAKQSVWERVNAAASKFLEAVLGEHLHAGKLPAQLQGTVRRILVTDSTTLGMHRSLHKAFPGARNQNRRTPQACARVQVTMDLLHGRFLQFGLNGFTRNDQAASMDVLEVLQPGDLLLRDLGYFTLRSLAAIDQHGAFYLSRLRYKTSLFDADGERIALLKVLRKAAREKRSEVVFEAQLGRHQRLPVAVVAIRVPRDIAAQRRRKARQDRDRRLNRDAAYYELLGWSILVTNLPADVIRQINLVELYGLRWRIENVFKAWKSGLQPSAFSEHRSNRWHLRCLILGQMLVLSQLGINGQFHIQTSPQHPASTQDPARRASLFKTIDVLLLSGVLRPIDSSPELLHAQLDYHGRYEKRRRRPLPQAATELLNP
jgi:hypothetical protein